MRLYTVLFFSLLLAAPFLIFGQHQCSFAKQYGSLINQQSIYRSASDLENFDLKYHRLSLAVSPKRPWIEGVITSYFTMVKNSDRIAFNLGNHLKVDSIIYNKNRLSFTHSNDLLSFSLGQVKFIGSFDSVSVFYAGNPTLGKYRSFFIANHSTGKVLATQSEPYGAQDWWPNKSSLMDKFDSCDLIIITDTGLRAGGLGILEANYQLNDTQQVYFWKHRYPSNYYLIGLAISNYAVLTDSVLLRGTYLPIVNYIFPQSVSQSAPLLKATIPLMRVLDSVFGNYPYKKEKYGHMQWMNGGGMEHATMSSMGNFNFDLVAHELAHQWFGNKVTCSNWQDIWINESFATFINYLSYELLFGSDSFYKELSKLNNFAKRNESLSVWVEDTVSVGRIFNQDLSYHKGAMVLQTLRFYIGDTAFFAACRNFLNDPILAFGVANTQQLIQHFKNVSNKPLDQFFNAFYYSKAYPSYLVKWSNNGNQVKIVVTQSSFDNQTVFFRHSIPLTILLESGQELSYNIDIDKGQLSFTLPISGKVKEVFFNKNNQVLASGTVAKISNSVLDDFEILPNPTINNFRIISNKITLNDVYIYNNLGQLIIKIAEINRYEQSVDLSAYANQQFIIKIVTNNGNFIKRITKN